MLLNRPRPPHLTRPVELAHRRHVCRQLMVHVTPFIAIYSLSYACATCWRTSKWFFVDQGSLAKFLRYHFPFYLNYCHPTFILELYEDNLMFTGSRSRSKLAFSFRPVSLGRRLLAHSHFLCTLPKMKRKESIISFNPLLNVHRNSGTCWTIRLLSQTELQSWLALTLPHIVVFVNIMCQHTKNIFK